MNCSEGNKYLNTSYQESIIKLPVLQEALEQEKNKLLGFLKTQCEIATDTVNDR